MTVTWTDPSSLIDLQSFVVTAIYQGPCTGTGTPAQQSTSAGVMDRMTTLALLEEFSQYNVTVVAMYSQFNETASIVITTLPTG